MIASLPMYDWPELKSETDQFWNILARHFDRAGFPAPRQLSRGEESLADWLRKDLFFSQTCGYPFATKLIGKVNLLGTPHYGVEGCKEANYSSAIVVHVDSQIRSIKQATGGKFAYNGSNSLSGYRCLSPLVGSVETAFANSIESGGHRMSAKMVACGEADVAAVDAVCWNYFQRFEAGQARKLRVLAWTPKLPSLPFITNGAISEKDLELMRKTLALGIDEAIDLGAADALRITGISVLSDDSYAPLSAL